MQPKMMRVKAHAIRRYKQRIGKKHASRDNVINLIRREVKEAWRKGHFTYSEEKYTNGRSKFALVRCSNFIAIVSKNAIITVYEKNANMTRADVYQEFITQTFVQQREEENIGI